MTPSSDDAVPDYHAGYQRRPDPPPEYERSFAHAFEYTFQIPQVAANLDRFMGAGKERPGWADPFAGYSDRAEFRNDIDPATPQPNHMLAEEFIPTLPDGLAGVLLDWPYSTRQIMESYQRLKLQPRKIDTGPNFWSRIKDAIAPKVRPGGLAIVFGWNTGGLGKKRGFRLLKVLDLYHGGAHYDTLITIERRVNGDLRLADEATA